MSRDPLGVSTSRWGPYVVAGALLLVDYLLMARGLSHVRAGFDYQVWSLNHGLYSDILNLSLKHYIRAGHVIHPLPYVHDRIEYPVLLGFVLWLPSWLPGGPASWFAAAGVLTAAATFGSIALLRRQHPPSAWWIAATPALLLDAAINWDLVGIVFLIAAVVWFGERRFALSGASAALGTWFKLFPVIVAPMALAALGARWWRSSAAPTLPAGTGTPHGSVALVGPVVRRPSARWRPFARWLIPFAALSAVIMVPFLLVARSNTLWFFRFNSERPEKDSLWGMLGKVVGTTVVDNHTINDGSLLVVVVAVAYGAWMVWRTADADQARAVALAAAMTIIAWMAVNKIWNPQYVLWVFAAGAIAAMPARYGVSLGILSVYDYWFEFVLRLPDQPNSYSWVGFGSTIARTVIFVLMAAWCVRQLRQTAPVPVAVPAAGAAAPNRS